MNAPLTPNNNVPTPASSPVKRGGYWRLIFPMFGLLIILGVWQRERLWVWYYADRMERASDDQREEWALKLATKGERALPTLLNFLKHENSEVCNAAKIGIIQMTSNWSANDPSRARLCAWIIEIEPKLSDPGRLAVMEMILEQPKGYETLTKTMVAKAVNHKSPAVRVKSIALAIQSEQEIAEVVLPMLNDQAPEVRRAAMLVVGPTKEGDFKPVISDDDLLKWLHDSDAQVRELCEMSLMSRGRTKHDIRLGKRYTAPNAVERQKLLTDLLAEEELDITVWLERLSTDSDPSVRAGVSRVAMDRRTDINARLAEMSRTDPDPTVRRIVNYYRAQIQKNQDD